MDIDNYSTNHPPPSLPPLPPLPPPPQDLSPPPHGWTWRANLHGKYLSPPVEHSPPSCTLHASLGSSQHKRRKALIACVGPADRRQEAGDQRSEARDRSQEPGTARPGGVE
ncbi:hypothetical protein V493_07864 [Pseudogymnoascus sp. VKM F-4281 (FW-2241)]|nr:hypothetical protein V493_07864 [Pseudogymnoascus sp. VKM F-4281 (FW-2241)]